MKKLILPLALVILFTLSACASVAQANLAGTETTTSSTGILNTRYDNALSINAQLAVGVFALEDTDNALTAAQAAELLPLWRAAQALSDSSTITTEEFQAIFTQIEETMTTEQLNAIAALQLTSQNMMAYTQPSQATGNGTQTTAQTGQLSGTAPTGDAPAGGSPDGGAFIGGDPGGGAGGIPDVGGTSLGTGSTTQTSTSDSTTASTLSGDPILSRLYDQIIQLLESKGQ